MNSVRGIELAGENRVRDRILKDITGILRTHYKRLKSAGLEDAQQESHQQPPYCLPTPSKNNPVVTSVYDGMQP